MNAYRDQLLTVGDSSPLDRVHNTGPGALLKEKREEMGLSREQIAQTTKIRPHILQALEEENWDSLPSSAFVKGFLRSYARSLGLDENVVADAYLEISKDTDSQPKIERRPARRKKGKVLYIFSALILLAGLFFLFTYGEQIWDRIAKEAGNAVTEDSSPAPVEKADKIFESKELVSTDDQTTIPTEPAISSRDSVLKKSPEIEIAEPKTEQPEESLVIPSGTAQISEADSPPDETVVAAPPPSSNGPSEKSLLLKANVKERTWIRVFVDDREPKDYVFQPGSEPEWTAEKGFELLIGNAGGVELGLEGTAMKTPGKKGQVIRLSIPEGYERRNKNN